MIYGLNLLSSVVSDWTLVNGSMTTESITLQPNGTATQSISLAKLDAIPEQMAVSVVASKYAGAYEGSIYAIIQATQEDGIVYTYNVPIVDTGNGTCILEIPLTAIQHKTLTFTFKSSVLVTFTDWALLPPKQSDVDLTEITDKLPRLLKDYNTKGITVGQEEDIIALISSYITDDTELTGHFTITYKASENCGLIVRIKDNETSELYTPMLFYLQAGSGSVSIPHAYLTRLKGYHNFTVTAQVTNGTIQIDTRRVLYVIDGGRIAYSLLDVGSVVYDLALRKMATETKVSYIYAICIDDGTCLIKKCEYSETPGAAWISVASIGPAIDAAIEFDGAWNLQSTLYSFDTDEYPYIGWVTPDNKLKVKRLDDDDTLVELATDVVKVSVVKGWDNTFNPGDDHGLLFVYIKNDGIPYYRGWCRQLNNTFLWEYERPITAFTGTAVDVNAFRANDFRVGINVLDSEGTTHTYLTPRNWAGMSGINENIPVAFTDILFNVYEITYIDTFTTEHLTAGLEVAIAIKYADPFNKFISIANADDGTGNYGIYVNFETAYRLNNLSPLDFLLTDSRGDTYPCVTITETSLNHYQATFIDFNGADHIPKTVTLLCSGANVKNDAGYSFNSFTGTFVPTGLIHPIIPVAVVEVIWNE